jgi:hypothetical protein
MLLGPLLALPGRTPPMRRVFLFFFLMVSVAVAAPRKVHVIALGAARTVPYSREGDPAGARTGEKILRVRPLIVDGQVKDWTTGEAHDLTDRSFVVRRALRLNDVLPGDKHEHWVWQRGPWILVNRVNGHAQPLKLPDYDPVVSQLSWFRDYAAYCGVSASGKSLYAVVMQVGARKPALAKKLGSYDAEHHPDPVCAPVGWQREPFRASFQPTGAAATSFDIVPGSAVLVEESADEEEKSGGK